MTVMIHSGSRGLGYQVCDDAVKIMVKAAGEIRDRSFPTASSAALP